MELPIQRGNSYIKRILSIYSDLFRNKYGFHPKVTMGKFGSLMKALHENLSEVQIAALLIVFFNWKGMTNSDAFEEKKLLGATHNPGWFSSSINQYEAYIRNVWGLNFDDENEVVKFVSKAMTNIKDNS